MNSANPRNCWVVNATMGYIKRSACSADTCGCTTIAIDIESTARIQRRLAVCIYRHLKAIAGGDALTRCDMTNVIS
jgi:hypothetical protein